MITNGQPVITQNTGSSSTGTIPPGIQVHDLVFAVFSGRSTVAQTTVADSSWILMGNSDVATLVRISLYRKRVTPDNISSFSAPTETWTGFTSDSTCTTWYMRGVEHNAISSGTPLDSSFVGENGGTAQTGLQFGHSTNTENSCVVYPLTIEPSNGATITPPVGSTIISDGGFRRTLIAVRTIPGVGYYPASWNFSDPVDTGGFVFGIRAGSVVEGRILLESGIDRILFENNDAMVSEDYSGSAVAPSAATQRTLVISNPALQRSYNF